MAKQHKKLDEKTEDLEQQLGELTLDLQRTRADFENYRKNSEANLARAEERSRERVVKQLLPIVDALDMATVNLPESLADDDWAKGVMATRRNMERMMKELGLIRQPVRVGDAFDHDQHEAISFEGGEGESEIIAEVMRPGYLYKGLLEINSHCLRCKIPDICINLSEPHLLLYILLNSPMYLPSINLSELYLLC